MQSGTEMVDQERSNDLAGEVFEGVLPCGSCAGIETAIWLRTDHTFWRKRTYLGQPEEEADPSYDVGRWVETIGGRVVLTSNDGSTTRFAKEDGPALSLLDVYGGSIDSEANHALRRSTRSSFESVGPFPLRGMYTYFADAAIFLPCNTGVRIPVAMVERHVDLETNYLQNRAAPGAPLFVEIEAKLAQTPAMEGEGTEESVIVTSFLESHSDESCGRPSDLSNPAGWKLTEIDGVVVRREDPASVPDLTFSDGKVAGSTGCNRLTGPALSSGDSLKIGPLAVTRRACSDPIEWSFVSAIDTVDSYEIFDRQLELMSGDKSVAAFLLQAGE